MADYITTYTGDHFDPTLPEAEHLHIEDIAHALSLICRGNGHVKTFFPLAVIVSTVQRKQLPVSIPTDWCLPVCFTMQVKPTCQMFQDLLRSIFLHIKIWNRIC